MDRQDWIKSPADQTAWDNGCRPDPEAADAVRRFFRVLRHSKGQFAGQPFELLPWQWEDVIRPLFGWKRPDGTRRFRRAYVEIPKKNGKSTLAAGISLYLLIGDREPGAEVYNAASDREQASIVFNECASMVAASPALTQRVETIRSQKRLIFHERNSLLKALSADVPTKEGLNIHGLIFDELHAQPTRKLWDTLRYGGASRRQPLFVSITTAGYDRTSICWEQHLYAKGILDGSIRDDSFFTYIRAADPEDDWKDPVIWRKANPSFGVTVNEDSFAEDCREAQQSPAQENSFRRYRLNQWTEQDVRWLSMERWDKCAGTFDAEPGAVCFGGLDLATVTDIAALVLLFPLEDGSFGLRPIFWVPQEAIKSREKRGRVRIDQWVRAGLIRTTPGDVIDYDVIRKEINHIAVTYQLRELAIDRWNAHQLTTQLVGDGVEVVGFGQGYASMTAPTKELEKLVLAGRIAHGGDPVLRWMAGNVAVEQDAAGNLKPSKKKSPEKIDGIVAAVMALGRCMLTDLAPSGYEDKGHMLS